LQPAKKNEAELDKETITAVCIDDFAIKKRQRYGTIMVDADTARIIDMIPSREIDDVSMWLSGFPYLQTVSRDGSTMYAAAITLSHPSALQVSDRFHLIKSINDRARDILHRMFSGRVIIPLTKETAHREIVLGSSNRVLKADIVRDLYAKGNTLNEIYGQTGISPKTIQRYLKMENEIVSFRKTDSREAEHLAAVKRLSDKVKIVRELSSNGYGTRLIQQKTGIHPQTIRKYRSPSFVPVNGQYGKHREGKLAPYREKVLQMRSSGIAYAKIFETIKAEGYKGGLVSLRALIARERRFKDKVQSSYGNKSFELIDKKWLLRLLYQPIEKVSGISKEQFKMVMKTYPAVKQVYYLVYDFKSIILDNKLRRLSYWIKRASAMDIPEMNRFLNGLNKDINAIKNSIVYDYNNGLAEGKVNKLKVIKRIMYGRCSFDLLRKKVLSIENLS
jgi:DNA-binding CsgD family transcriptional regulator